MTAPSTDGDSTAVFEALPQPPPLPGGVPIGDVTQTGEQPLFEQDHRGTLTVIVNVSYARLEGGERAIRVLDEDGKVIRQLNAAQAHQLAVDLHDTADIVGEIRQKAGYTS